MRAACVLMIMATPYEPATSEKTSSTRIFFLFNTLSPLINILVNSRRAPTARAGPPKSSLARFALSWRKLACFARNLRQSITR